MTARRVSISATVLAARERSGDSCLAVTLKAGRYNLVRFVPVAGKRSPERINLALGLDGPALIAALESYAGPCVVAS